MGVGNWLSKTLGSFKKPGMSSLERAGYAIQKSDNFTNRMQAHKPFYDEWSKMQAYELAIQSGEEKTEEEGKEIVVNMPVLIKRERSLLHNAFAFVMGVAIPYYRSMENSEMCQKLFDWTDIYVDYKMRETRYSVSDEADGGPLRVFRLQAIGAFFKVIGIGYSDKDVGANDVYIIPSLMPPGGNIIVRKPVDED